MESIPEFVEELRRAKSEYDIRLSTKNNRKAAKRAVILVSTAYLKCGGSVHWVQEIEAHLMRALKETPLTCDPLEMEGVDRSYTKHGKRYCATQFENHLVNERCWVSEPLPIVKAILKILKEEVKEDVQSEFQPNHTRRRAAKTLESEQGAALKYEEKGATVHRTFENSEIISQRKCFEVAE